MRVADTIHWHRQDALAIGGRKQRSVAGWSDVAALAITLQVGHHHVAAAFVAILQVEKLRLVSVAATFVAT